MMIDKERDLDLRSSSVEHQDDVICTIRALDRQYQSKVLYCGCHVMTYAKISSLVTLLLTLIMIVAFMIGPLNKLHIVSELLVFVAACLGTAAMFMAVNRRKPMYCWPYVTFTSFASFYSITWFVIYSTRFMRKEQSVGFMAMSNVAIVHLVLWCLSSLMYAWFTIIGYQLFMYLKAYHRVYEAAAINIIGNQSTAQTSTDNDDVIISRGHDSSDLSNNRAYGRLV